MNTRHGDGAGVYRHLPAGRSPGKRDGSSLAPSCSSHLQKYTAEPAPSRHGNRSDAPSCARAPSIRESTADDLRGTPSVYAAQACLPVIHASTQPLARGARVKLRALSSAAASRAGAAAFRPNCQAAWAAAGDLRSSAPRA